LLNQEDQLVASNEVLRKGLHLVVAALPLMMLEIGRLLSLAILVPVTLLAVTADIIRSRSSRFESLIQKVFGMMMRRDEQAGEGHLIVNGATWVLLSLTLLTVVFDLETAGPSFMMFMVADAAAAIAGRTLGKHQWPWSRRTLEGSLAFVVSALGIGLLFAGISGWSMLAASLVGMIAESLPGPLNDNIRVPFLMALAMYIASMIV